MWYFVFEALFALLGFALSLVVGLLMVIVRLFKPVTDEILNHLNRAASSAGQWCARAIRSSLQRAARRVKQLGVHWKNRQRKPWFKRTKRPTKNTQIEGRDIVDAYVGQGSYSNKP